MKVDLGPETEDHEDACTAHGLAVDCTEKLHEWLHDAYAQEKGPEAGIALIDAAVAHLAAVRAEISLSAMKCANEYGGRDLLRETASAARKAAKNPETIN